MDCFLDFCLACDRESTSGPYCSQRCRLADLERGSPSSSPTTTTSRPRSSWAPKTSTTTTTNSPTIPAQPQRYASFSPRNSLAAATADPSRHRPQSLYFSPPFSSSPADSRSSPERVLTPSSSRSSLSSTTSTSSGVGIPEDARRQLEGYNASLNMGRRVSSW